MAPWMTSAFTVAPIVDSTGCGDTFRAACQGAFLDGASGIDCLGFGNAAAALKLRDVGRRGCPRRADVWSLLEPQ